MSVNALKHLRNKLEITKAISVLFKYVNNMTYTQLLNMIHINDTELISGPISAWGENLVHRCVSRDIIYYLLRW